MNDKYPSDYEYAKLNIRSWPDGENDDPLTHRSQSDPEIANLARHSKTQLPVHCHGLKTGLGSLASGEMKNGGRDFWNLAIF